MTSAELSPRDGGGEHTSQQEEALDPEAITQMVRAAFDDPGYQPPVLPSTALELLEIARRPDVTFPVVARLIEREPILASQLLRIAQSPVYRRAARIHSLEQAAALLGLSALADLFLQASLTAKVFRAPSYDEPMNRLRLHSVATALLSRLVCQETTLPDDYAFLCGLLHDIGIAACLIALADHARATRGPARPAEWHVVWPVIREMHERESLNFGQLWQLPGDVCGVIGHHHTLMVGGVVHPMAAVFCVADSIASDLGHGMPGETDCGQVATAMKALDIRPSRARRLRENCEILLASA